MTWISNGKQQQQQQQQHRRKFTLIGHSLGCLSSTCQVFGTPLTRIYGLQWNRLLGFRKASILYHLDTNAPSVDCRYRYNASTSIRHSSSSSTIAVWVNDGGCWNPSRLNCIEVCLLFSSQRVAAWLGRVDIYKLATCSNKQWWVISSIGHLQKLLKRHHCICSQPFYSGSFTCFLLAFRTSR